MCYDRAGRASESGFFFYFFFFFYSAGTLSIWFCF